ncbi:hypothetical protein Barb4_03454 [Bacteroidales bacterium Barb4]|nr:hypothetical protein Barb4_03454 [Bacteroidales bacterium Barb4]
MPNLDMDGPYKMNSAMIDAVITGASAGNYALGYKCNGDNVIRYVGRSDTDVNMRLKDHLSEEYEIFFYSYATSPKTAFEKECKNFHDFGGETQLNNIIHPDKPSNSKHWRCPVLWCATNGYMSLEDSLRLGYGI